MKLIVAGSRDLYFAHYFIDAIEGNVFDFDDEDNELTEVVSGDCETGVDKAGEGWANSVGLAVTKFPADWDTHGKAAGPIRNKQMAKYADRLLLIWDGKSKGSANMKKEMQKLNKPIYEVILKTEKLEEVE